MELVLVSKDSDYVKGELNSKDGFVLRNLIMNNYHYKILQLLPIDF